MVFTFMHSGILKSGKAYVAEAEEAEFMARAAQYAKTIGYVGEAASMVRWWAASVVYRAVWCCRGNSGSHPQGVGLAGTYNEVMLVGG